MSDLSKFEVVPGKPRFGRWVIYTMLGGASGLMALAILISVGSLGAPPWLLTRGIGTGTILTVIVVLIVFLCIASGTIGYRRFKNRG